MLVKNFFPTKLTLQIYAIIMKLSKSTFFSPLKLPDVDMLYLTENGSNFSNVNFINKSLALLIILLYSSVSEHFARCCVIVSLVKRVWF